MKKILVVALMLFASNAYAADKVVVIPMAGDKIVTQIGYGVYDATDKHIVVDTIIFLCERCKYIVDGVEFHLQYISKL